MMFKITNKNRSEYIFVLQNKLQKFL